MCAGLPNTSFKLLGYAKNLLLHIFAILVHLAKLGRATTRTTECHSWRFGDKPCKRVGFTDRVLQHTCNVLYRTPWCHLPESDDVGYMITPVFVAKIFHNLPAPGILNINVNVRH